MSGQSAKSAGTVIHSDGDGDTTVVRGEWNCFACRSSHPREGAYICCDDPKLLGYWVDLLRVEVEEFTPAGRGMNRGGGWWLVDSDREWFDIAAAMKMENGYADFASKWGGRYGGVVTKHKQEPIRTGGGRC